jgi:ubiquitin C-terminal hydrolase
MQRGQPYNPQALHAAVCRIAPQFKGRQQQDSHELLRFLMDGERPWRRGWRWGWRWGRR